MQSRTRWRAPGVIPLVSPSREILQPPDRTRAESVYRRMGYRLLRLI
jgi:hypothetical protein